MIEIPNNCAIITDNVEEVAEFLLYLKKYGHIYLINSDKPFYHPRVSMLKCDAFDQYSRIIYKSMFDKRLLHIVSDTANEFCTTIKNKTIELINLDRGFCFGSGGTLSIENFWNNLSSIMDNPNTTGFKDIMKDKPVILVAAGPSLNKSIEIIKQNKDKVVIVACSTAIAALHKHNITPHFLIAIDPYPMMGDLILPYCTKDTILLASSVLCHDVIKDYPGSVIYFHTNGGLQIMGNMYKDLNISEGIYTSATVSSAALSLALFMGFNPIIFCGQDMALTDDIIYADGIDGVKGDTIIEMETFDGRKVKTIQAYKEVYDYFNGFVPTIKDKEIINCSDGAGILGAKVMTMQDVANQYFIDDIQLPEFKLNKMVDKAKILSNLCLIKEDIIETQRFIRVFKHYIDLLFNNNIKYEFIQVEIDEFLDRIREKNATKFIDTFVSWIWYLLPQCLEKEDKLGSLDLLDDSFSKFLGLMNKQIEILGVGKDG